MRRWEGRGRDGVVYENRLYYFYRVLNLCINSSSINLSMHIIRHIYTQYVAYLYNPWHVLPLRMLINITRIYATNI